MKSSEQQKKFRRQFRNLENQKSKTIYGDKFLTISEKIVDSVRDKKIPPTSKLVRDLNRNLGSVYRSAKKTNHYSSKRIKALLDETKNILDNKSTTTSTSTSVLGATHHGMWWVFVLVGMLVIIIFFLYRKQEEELKDDYY